MDGPAPTRCESVTYARSSSSLQRAKADSSSSVISAARVDAARIASTLPLPMLASSASCSFSSASMVAGRLSSSRCSLKLSFFAAARPGAGAFAAVGVATGAGAAAGCGRCSSQSL